MSNAHPDETAAVIAAALHGGSDGARYGIGPGGLRDTYTTHRMRLALRQPGRSAPASAWARIPPSTRTLLVTLATDRRDADAAARMAWEAFTPEERAALRQLARTLRDDLEPAGGLRP